MKTVIITGSARGFGFELAKVFRKNNYNIVLSDIEEDVLKESNSLLTNSVKGDGKVIYVKCDVTCESDLQNLLDETIKEFKTVDIWINNAGVNQEMLPAWEVSTSTINRLIDIDLKSVIIGSKIAMNHMIKQGFGQIYAVEGYGSNDAKMLGLSIYGTSKRGLTYFLEALAKEVDEKKLPIQVGILSPGIMITNFTTHYMGKNEFELPERVKKVYNILGDYPDVIANYLGKKIIANNKNGQRFSWLTNSKAFKRFILAGFNKRDFFKSLPENNKEE